MQPRSAARRAAAGRRLLLATVVLTLLLVDGLARPRTASADTLSAETLSAETLSADPPSADVVAAAVDGYLGQSIPGTLAAVVARQHLPADGLGPQAADARAARTDDAWADNGWAAARRFPTASLVKLFVAEDLLHRARTGGLVPRPQDPDLMRRMIASSDDPAASALWVRYDGERLVRSVARRYDLTSTAPPAVAGQWGQTTTSAGDLARFLTLLPVVAHPDDADTLLGWMRAATPTGADGFDQRFGLFGAGAASGEPAAVKQGWMCCVGGQRHVHSVGVVGRTVVVLLSEVPRQVGYGPARTALTAAAAAAAETAALPRQP